MKNGEPASLKNSFDTEEYIHMLNNFHPLRADLLKEAVNILQLPAASRGLDAGCGIGLSALPLAEAVGAEGNVTGVDASVEFLACAEGMVENAGLAKRMVFKQGDIRQLPFADQTFDWVWSVDCAGYQAENLLPLFLELVRVIKPGGKLALLFYSSDKLLPGHPLLEARLNATAGGIAPFHGLMKPETHYLRTLRWMQAVGLQELTGRTLIADLQAPLSDVLRQALLDLMHMRWGQIESQVTDEDWAAYQRLCRPESSECIVNLPDYYGFFTYTMFYGIKQESV